MRSDIVCVLAVTRRTSTFGDEKVVGLPECHFYRAMHFSAYARSWDRMSSVCPSVCL